MITAWYAALLGLMQVSLTTYVVFGRWRYGVSLGDGDEAATVDDETLPKAQRRDGVAQRTGRLLEAEDEDMWDAGSYPHAQLPKVFTEEHQREREREPERDRMSLLQVFVAIEIPPGLLPLQFVNRGYLLERRGTRRGGH